MGLHMTTTYTTLIQVPELKALQASRRPLMVFDCSFDLAEPAAGETQFTQTHIPGAVYAHLDRHLSAPKDPATGRPMPGAAVNGGPALYTSDAAEWGAKRRAAASKGGGK